MGYGGASFAPVTFDGEQAPPPDITAGKYRFQIVAIEALQTVPVERAALRAEAAAERARAG